MIIKNKPLVVLEVANNHQGDINHGKEIVTKFSEVCDDYRNKFEFAIQFQYRNLKTFIHHLVRYVYHFLVHCELVYRTLEKILMNSKFKRDVPISQKYSYQSFWARYSKKENHHFWPP